MIRFLACLVCAGLSWPKKASEGLPWVNGHPASEEGGWFHHRVNDWVENFRGPEHSINTRVWSCFLAFVALTQFIVISVLCLAVIYLGVQ